AFVVDNNRKPHLASELGVQFNLSHSANRALIGVCREAAIGVDIEKVRKRARLADIAGRFFSAAEQAALADYADGADYRGAFYRIWTRKEAVIKATGEGLSAVLDAFDVAAGQTATLLADRNPGRSAADWQLAHVAAGGDYVGAIAVRTPHPITIEYLDDWRQAA
ncbi:MAG: 4'-phosphopantetheinyl transferase superfamily protein, partial [Pseudomonadota bacterium]